MNSLKTVVLFVLVFVALFLGGCQAFYGAVADVETGSGWLRRQLKPVNDSMERSRVRNAARLVLEEDKRQGPDATSERK